MQPVKVPTTSANGNGLSLFLHRSITNKFCKFELFRLDGLYVSDVHRYAPNVHSFDGDTSECTLQNCPLVAKLSSNCKIVHKLQNCPPCGHTLPLESL